MSTSPAPPRRGDKRERTRKALIAAALAVIEEKGFAGASLDEIARRAGMSRGAIYSNFPNRSDLMLAAIAARGLEIDRDFSAPGTLRQQLRRFAENIVAVLPQAQGVSGWHAESYAHVVGDPALRAHVAAGFGEGFARMAAQFEGHHGEALAISGHSLALAVQALAMGFLYQAILSPEAVAPRAVLDAYDALADGALKRA